MKVRVGAREASGSVCGRIVKKGRSVGGSGWAQGSGEEYLRVWYVREDEKNRELTSAKSCHRPRQVSR